MVCLSSISEGVTTFYPVTCRYRIRIFPNNSVGVTESPPDFMVSRIKLFGIVFLLGIAFRIIDLIKHLFHEIWELKGVLEKLVSPLWKLICFHFRSLEISTTV